MEFFILIAVTCSLFVINAQDMVKHTIGNRILSVLLVITVVSFLYTQEDLLGTIAGAGIFSAPFFFVYLINKKAMGAGDVKFSLLAGALVGYWFSMLLLFLTGLAFAAYLYYNHKKRIQLPPTEEIPFAPFISVPLIVILTGQAVF